jgi:hypothetical protein
VRTACGLGFVGTGGRAAAAVCACGCVPRAARGAEGYTSTVVIDGKALPCKGYPRSAYEAHRMLLKVLADLEALVASNAISPQLAQLLANLITYLAAISLNVAPLSNTPLVQTALGEAEAAVALLPAATGATGPGSAPGPALSAAQLLAVQNAAALNGVVAGSALTAAQSQAIVTAAQLAGPTPLTALTPSQVQAALAAASSLVPGGSGAGGSASLFSPAQVGAMQNAAVSAGVVAGSPLTALQASAVHQAAIDTGVLPGTPLSAAQEGALVQAAQNPQPASTVGNPGVVTGTIPPLSGVIPPQVSTPSGALSAASVAVRRAIGL